jgi:hypothetical protein
LLVVLPLELPLRFPLVVSLLQQQRHHQQQEREALLQLLWPPLPP